MTPLMPGDTRRLLRRLRSLCLPVAVIGVIASAVGAFIAPVELQRALLIAFVFWTGTALGALGFLMIHHLTAGRWSFTLQRILEGLAVPLPAMGALFLVFLPFLFGLDDLFVWTHPETTDHAYEISKKAGYLNVPFFWFRYAVYFAVFLGLLWAFTRWSLRLDDTGDPKYGLRMRALAGPGLLTYVLLAGFASIDWMMSLDPTWTSSIYVLQFVVSNGLSGLALATLILTGLMTTPSHHGHVSPETLRRIGTLVLALVILWAYCAFSQYIIIWQGNLPSEITWYIHRSETTWKWLSMFVLFFHLALPFGVLLWRHTKKSAGVLRWTCLGLLVAHFFEREWMITPTLHPHEFHIHWLDFTVFAGVGGIFLVIAFSRMLRYRLLPSGDPRFHPEEGEHHG